eukprot:SAG22_NODE_58_length_23645_cov_16.637943_20_plen_30_part_00
MDGKVERGEPPSSFAPVEEGVGWGDIHRS